MKNEVVIVVHQMASRFCLVVHPTWRFEGLRELLIVEFRILFRGVHPVRPCKGIIRKGFHAQKYLITSPKGPST